MEISFDKFVDYGVKNTTNIVNDVPWSFNFNGYAVTHENDDCYLLSNGLETIRFERGTLLTINEAFCEYCRDVVNYKISDIEKEKQINGKVIRYIGKIAHCDDCEEEIFVHGIRDYNLNALGVANACS